MNEAMEALEQGRPYTFECKSQNLDEMLHDRNEFMQICMAWRHKQQECDYMTEVIENGKRKYTCTESSQPLSHFHQRRVYNQMEIPYTSPR
jgi:hypothetical protein